MQRIVQITLPEEAEGRPLVEYLVQRFTYLSQEGWRKNIQEGRMTVDGVLSQPEDLLHAGCLMVFTPEERPEPPVSFQVQVLFEDERFLVLNKPPNLPCHPAGAYFNHTLWAALKEGRLEGVPELPEPHLVNRLDRETSGIVLIAKSGSAAGWAARALKAPTSIKRYQVLVEGSFPDQLEATGWLSADTASAVTKKRRFSFEKPMAKCEECQTCFRRLSYTDGISRVEATLRTGRLHQIRATLCSLGYPVVGDKLYGVDDTIFLRFCAHRMTPEDQEKLRLPYQALHASELRLGEYRFVSQPWFSCGNSPLQKPRS